MCIEIPNVVPVQGHFETLIEKIRVFFQNEE